MGHNGGTMSRHKAGWLANPLGPLEREVFEELKGWSRRIAYQRFRAWPIGNTAFGVRDLRKAIGHGYDDDTLTVYVKDMILDGALYGSIDCPKGYITNMHLTVAPLDRVPGSLEQVDPGAKNDGGGLHTFLATYGIAYRKHTNFEWPRTGKEIGLAKQVMKKCEGDARRAGSLVRMFFNQPMEAMPDDVSFTSFYFSVDKLLAGAIGEQRWEQARVAGARDARARMAEPTPEETAAYHAENARNREETQRRKELERQREIKAAEDD